MSENAYVADFSLALINRTGAYYVCRDVVERLSEFFVSTRYWRFDLTREPKGWQRRILARAMMFELAHSNWFPPPRGQARTGGMPTVFFDPLYVLGRGVCRTDIVLCHDIGPVSHSDLFDPRTCRMYRDAYARIVAARPGVVFVSDASRSAFIDRFGEDFRFLTTIPLYVRAGADDGPATAVEGISRPFLLTVGAMEIRKNYPRVFEAFADSGLREQGFSYVFCGPRGYGAQSIGEAAQRTPGVTALGYVTDAELRWLYRNAAGFVLPSLLEGFGLPALEAAMQGLVPLVSEGSALTEATGDGAVSVDPLSTDAIAEGMRSLVHMTEGERRSRVDQVRGRARALSFENYLTRWSNLLSRG